MSIVSASNCLILLCFLLLLASVFPSIRVFSNEPALCIRKYLQYHVLLFKRGDSRTQFSKTSLMLKWCTLDCNGTKWRTVASLFETIILFILSLYSSRINNLKFFSLCCTLNMLNSSFSLPILIIHNDLLTNSFQRIISLIILILFIFSVSSIIMKTC